MDNSKSNILSKIKSEECINIFKEAQINTVILFGSILTEDFAEYSDIDIAILSENEMTFNTIACMEETLQKILDRDVDIINLKDKNVELNIKVDIYDNGDIIYYNDDLKLYNIDYAAVERVYKENENFRYFRERDVVFSE